MDTSDIGMIGEEVSMKQDWPLIKDKYYVVPAVGRNCTGCFRHEEKPQYAIHHGSMVDDMNCTEFVNNEIQVTKYMCGQRDVRYIRATDEGVAAYVALMLEQA